MTQIPESLVLGHLVHIRGKVDAIDTMLNGVEGRMTALETDFVALAKVEAGRNLDLETIARKVQRLERRVAKLEQRSTDPDRHATAGPTPADDNDDRG